MTTLPAVQGRLPLADVDSDAVQIGALYCNAKLSMVDGVRYLAEAGRKLIAKKKSVGHGQWLLWLKINADVLGFETPLTAQRLMNAAKSIVNDVFDETVATAISREVWGNSTVRGTTGTGENEWFTPPQFLDLARQVLGGIDLDPASNRIAQATVGARQFFTKKENGLKRAWHGRVWLNPPYAQPFIAQFVDKLLAERRTGRVVAAILLTHNYTDTAWFQNVAALADAICFTRGRVKFYEPDGTVAAPTQGQAFSYFGDDARLFASHFANVGFVVTPLGGR